MEYLEFLNSKNKLYSESGFNVDKSKLGNVLFDFQKDITQWSLKKGKAALFEECGLGKTLQQVMWAYQVFIHTNKNVLIIAPLGVTRQTKEEAKEKLNIDINICRSQDDVKFGLNITNYEIIDKFNGNEFIGVVLDESSILKSYTGSTRKNLKNKFNNTPYKLLCTATPAPNDYMELLNQGDFLGVMETDKALATFFINDMKTGSWRLKGHAIKDFWKWVSSWAVYINSPSDLGYSNDGYDLPKLNEINHILEIDTRDKTYQDGFFRKIDTSATSFHKEKKLTAPKRAKECSNIVSESNEQYLIWCDTNYEADLLKEAIPEAIEVRGSDKPSFKEEMSYKFKNGDIRVLISKPSIFGYGLNFQKCHNMIFCGLTYSYEDYHQAVKRIHRFGQKHEVNVHIVLGSTENRILETIKAKKKKQEIMKLGIKNNIKELQNNSIRCNKLKNETEVDKIKIPLWIKGDK